MIYTIVELQKTSN